MTRIEKIVAQRLTADFGLAGDRAVLKRERAPEQREGGQATLLLHCCTPQSGRRVKKPEAAAAYEIVSTVVHGDNIVCTKRISPLGTDDQRFSDRADHF